MTRPLLERHRALCAAAVPGGAGLGPVLLRARHAGLRWRHWLTQRFLARYLGQHAFYRLNAVTALDNPDQRISEDINSFTQQSLYFLMVGLGSLIDLVAFAGVLWSISRPLVLFLIGYAALVTFVTTSVFGRR
jgi:putative ATP-binding cassette transporter